MHVHALVASLAGEYLPEHLVTLWPLLAECLAKSVVVLAMAGAAALVLRRASAAMRHLVWLAAVLSLAALPALSWTLPAWRVLPDWAVARQQDEASATSAASARHVHTTTMASPPADSLRAVQADLALRDGWGDHAGPAGAEARVSPAATQRPSETGTRSTDHPRALHGPRLLVTAWAGGAALLLTAIGGGLAGLLLLSRRTEPVHNAALLATAEALRRRLGVRRAVRLRWGCADAMPMTWGGLPGRPASLLLPRAARQWDHARLEAVLLHELAHVKRRDCLAQVLAQLVARFYWMNPLAWVALHRMRIERERACDDLVLATGQRASDYAEQLLAVTACLRPRLLGAAAGLAMAHRRGIHGRVLAVLDKRRSRRGASRAAVAVIAALLAALVVPVAMVKAELGATQPSARLQAVASQPTQTRKDTPHTAAQAPDWLREPVSVDFNGNRLESVFDHLRTAHKQNILVPWPVLHEVNVAQDSTIDLQIEDVPFGQALQLVLDKASGARHRLGFGITGVDTILITRRADVAERVPADLIHPPADPGIQQQLHQRITVAYDGNSLEKVLDHWRRATGKHVNLAVNWRALEAPGVKRDTPVTLTLQDAPAGEVLRHILKASAGGDDKLGYTVEGNVVSVFAADTEPMRTINYDLRKLLPNQPWLNPPEGVDPPADAAQRRRQALDDLTTLIRDTVGEPSDWHVYGGRSRIGIREAGDATGHRVELGITAARAQHRQVVQLLRQLDNGGAAPADAAGGGLQGRDSGDAHDMRSDGAAPPRAVRVHRALLALSPSIDVSWEQVPFEQVIDELRTRLRVPFYLDWRDLEQAGVSRQEPITLTMQGPAHAVLRRSLDQASSARGADRPMFEMNDEGVVLILRDRTLASEQTTPTRVYDIRDLIEPADQAMVDPEDGAPADWRRQRVEALERVIRQSVGHSDDWVPAEGAFSSMRELNGNLIVRTSLRNHHELIGLLSQLRAAALTYAVETVCLLLAEGAEQQLAERGVHLEFNDEARGGVRVRRVVGETENRLAFADEPVPFATLSDVDPERLLEAARQSEGVQVVPVLRLMLRNAQWGEVWSRQEIPYIEGYERNDAGEFEPRLATYVTGVRAQAQATASADRRWIHMRWRPMIRTITGPAALRPVEDSADPALTVEHVPGDRWEADLFVRVPDGGNVLVRGGQIEGALTLDELAEQGPQTRRVVVIGRVMLVPSGDGQDGALP